MKKFWRETSHKSQVTSHKFQAWSLRLVACSLFCLAIQTNLFAQGTIQEHLAEASALFKEGQWDASEKDYLKATKSVEVEERIQAYEGLVKLYTKLKHLNKADLVQKKLDQEKEFQSELVPKGDSYYETYKVQKRDTYANLAFRKTISFEWLARINRRKALVIGDTILLPKMSYRLEVNKDEKTLSWKRGSEILKIYPIAIGREGMDTPEREFTVISKMKNPISDHL